MLYCGDIIKRTLCNCRNSASAMTLSLRLTAKRAQVGPAQARFFPSCRMHVGSPPKPKDRVADPVVGVAGA